MTRRLVFVRLILKKVAGIPKTENLQKFLFIKWYPANYEIGIGYPFLTSVAACKASSLQIIAI